MNSVEKEAVLHCLKSMIDEEVCEECPLYGTTGTDHCEKDCVRLAINALSNAEKLNKWIPVETALPEVGQRVIATVKSIDGNYVRETIYGKYGFLCGNCIAWMPLPEPYKTESEVK